MLEINTINAMPDQTVSIEAKYRFRLADQTLIHRFLDASCRADPEYHLGRVNSIYFDTIDRIHLLEKLNSDYLKYKVRLRWYGSLSRQDADDNVTAFLEVKAKEGVRRRKLRKEVAIACKHLTCARDSLSLLTEIANAAHECGWVGRGQLIPAMAIHYDRARYVDRQENSRLALDWNIEFSWVNTVLWANQSPRQLPDGVLEVKSPTGRIPRSLLPIRDYLSMRDSFSKYEECWLRYMYPIHHRGIRAAYVD